MVRTRQTKEELKRRGRHVMWNRRRKTVAATWDLVEKETPPWMEHSNGCHSKPQPRLKKMSQITDARTVDVWAF